MSSLRFAARLLCAALACLSLGVSPALAQSAVTGTIAGRVQNQAANLSLENARVTIAGTNREAFTSAFGDYRLTGVAPGTVTLNVFSTGLAPQTTTVVVAAGETVRRDFALAPSGTAPVTKDSTVKLDAFVVASARETNAATIAINEQRFAAGIKTVLSTDALGDVIQNNLGEFVKFLPGVDVGTDQMNSVQIGLRGLPSNYTNIALDGDDVNAAGSAGPTRNTLLQAFSLSNAQRVEIYKVPTPDMPASLAGGINMISRTAFEASRPELRFKAYINQNSREINLRRQSGGGDGDDQKQTYHYQPDFDFAYTVPVSKTFGFSINATKNDQFGSARRINRNFNTTVSAPLRSTVDNPYLQSLVYNVFPVYEHRYAIGTRLDWKVSPVDVLSFSYSGNWLVQDYEQHAFTIATGTNPFSWGDNFTHGRTGLGSATVVNTARYVRVRNNVLRLSYRHVGALWDFTGGVGYNFSDQTYRAISHRQFETAAGRIQAVTVDLDDYDQYLPGKITVRNAAGQIVDPFDLNSYSFFLNGASGTRDNDSTAKNARFDAKRKFFTDRANFSLKAGFSTHESYRARRNTTFNPVYVGKDGSTGTPNTATAAFALDESFTATPFSLLNAALLSYPEPRGLQQVQFSSGRRAWQLYENNPSYFNTQTNLRTDIRNLALTPDQITERLDALFLMGDFSFFNNRLRIVTGVRYERTTDDGRAVLQDNNARYRQDAAGNLILDAAKRPILIYPANTINTTTPEGIANGIAEDALVYQKLGTRLQKTYAGYYPSLNATYSLTQNVQARLGLAQAVGRPDFGNILGQTTVNQVDFDPASNATGTALGTITTKNPGLIPWTANSGDIRLEYYPANGAVLSAGFYRKQIKNTFATQNFLATPAFLANLGLGEEFEGYQVNAPINVPGITHINGCEFDLNAPLSTFTSLNFAKTIRVFANATLVTNRSPAEADFRGFTPKLINWGVSYSRRPLSVFAKWTLVGKKKVGTIAAGNIGAAGFNYQAERLRLDLSMDYRFNARYGFYATARNIFNDRDQNYSYAIGSPRYVKFAAEGEYGVNFQFGIKGNF